MPGGRPSNARIAAELTEAIEDARQSLYGDLVDQEHALLPVIRSRHTTRENKIKAAAKLAVVRSISDELNDTTSDIYVTPEDVKGLLQ